MSSNNSLGKWVILAGLGLGFGGDLDFGETGLGLGLGGDLDFGDMGLGLGLGGDALFAIY